MKRIYLAAAVALLTGAIGLTFLINKTDSVSASPAVATVNVPPLYGAADAFVLSCMDYRLTDETAKYFQDELGLKNNYDYVVLAGASLGVNNTKYPNWGQTFWQHLDTAIALHGIHEVIVMDHRNCGAYKVLLGKEFLPDAGAAQLKEETVVHKEQLDMLAKAIHEKYPKLEVSTLLMSLDGHVDEIGHVEAVKPADEKH
ncbi:MAG: carbonic anhydrase [Pyrinomonadaceae bacterium]